MVDPVDALEERSGDASVALRKKENSQNKPQKLGPYLRVFWALRIWETWNYELQLPEKYKPN